MSLFNIENLEKTYYTGGVETPVLRGLSFKIDRGEFVSIMGASGSGKSTLLHILGFLDKHTGGVYKFNEKEFGEYSEEEIARIRNEEMGFVFQTFNLLGRSSVYENVRLPLLYSKKPEKEWNESIKESLEHVGLSHRLNYPANKLSGGERQRVAIARALINSPRVVFADEPTGNLDSVSGEKVMETMRNLHREFGQTVILITHDRKVAEYADRMIEIKDGQVENDHQIVKTQDTRNKKQNF